MSAGAGWFRRGDRLRSSRDFQRVGRLGRRRASRSFVLLAAARGGVESKEQPRLGITVSRRLGNAVARNRVKRHVREWFRTHRRQIGRGVDLVVIARPSASSLSSVDIDGELTGALGGQVSARVS